MARYLAIAVLVFMAAVTGFTQAGGTKAKEKDKDKDFRVEGKLTKDDPKDAQRNGPAQSHAVKMKAGKVYTIDMVSSDFDCYLRLLNPKGDQIEEDDDSGGGLNSRIMFNCPTDGEYRIVTTTFGAGAMGSYVLTVKTAGGGGTPAPATAHAALLGKLAPDFSGDFALNGEPVRLADLKGKVVLLDFWEVRSSQSAALLPKLSEWQKTYKKDGLVVVGVTFYTSDIGQKLGFDKETGKVTTVKTADRKSDQALLKTFADHHKAEHLLMMLPKQNALTAFDAYVVNGVPQLVLIDRKGMIRRIDVTGEKGSAGVEAELKKLLAEK